MKLIGKASTNSNKGVAVTMSATVNITTARTFDAKKNAIRNARAAAGSEITAMAYTTTGGPGMAKAPFISPEAIPVPAVTDLGTDTVLDGFISAVASVAPMTESPIHS